jgi:cell division protein FtsL
MTTRGPAPAHVPAAEPRVRPPLRVVNPTERNPAARRRRMRVLAVLMVGVLVSGIFGLVGMNVVIAQEQFRLDRLETRATEQQATYDQLRLEVAELESPQRIVAEAQQRLGMVQPPAISYLTPSSPAPSPQGPASSSPTTSTDSSNRNPQLQSTLQSETSWSVVKRQLAGHP